MTAAAISTLTAANSGWSRTGPRPACPNAASKALITGLAAFGPALQDRQDRQSITASTRSAQISVAAIPYTIAKSP